MSSTDFATWQENAATNQPKWEARAKIISCFIRPCDYVLDLGAGDEKLRKYLPDSCLYFPVDCVMGSRHTFVVDFNKEFKLPARKVDVVVSAGFVEYLDDVPSFMTKLSDHCRGAYFLMTYSYSSGKKYRKLNNLKSASDVASVFSPYLGNFREVIRLKKQSLFSGVLGGITHPVCAKETLNDLITRPGLLSRIVGR